MVAAFCVVVLGCASQRNINKTVSTCLDLHFSWQGPSVESVEMTRDLQCTILLSMFPVQGVLYSLARTLTLGASVDKREQEHDERNSGSHELHCCSRSRTNPIYLRRKLLFENAVCMQMKMRSSQVAVGVVVSWCETTLSLNFSLSSFAIA